jgi:hypothetical protein
MGGSLAPNGLSRVKRFSAPDRCRRLFFKCEKSQTGLAKTAKPMVPNLLNPKLTENETEHDLAPLA